MIYFYFFILIFLSAFFSACEIAIFSLSPAQVKLMQQKRLKNAHLVLYFKKHPYKTLITILIGNNVVNILSASLATFIAVNVFGSLGVGIATGLVTLFILIFGEITPKSFAQKNNQFIARLAAPVLYFLMIVLYPLVWVLREFNLTLLRIFKIKAASFVPEEEIRSLTRLGVEKGDIHYREHRLIEKVFRFNDIAVGEIMTPRYKMVVLNGDVPVEQIAHFVSQTGFSRYPVYENNEDNIIGYIHINDLMRVLNSDEREKLVKRLVRPIRRVKNLEKIEPLFRAILKDQDHLALVVRGVNRKEVVGLVTLEDILEELVGDISDETDEDRGIAKL